MSTTKNGRRKKQIEFNSDACAQQAAQIKAKIERKGEWKFKTKKSAGKQVAAPKKDGKKPKLGLSKE